MSKMTTLTHYITAALLALGLLSLATPASAQVLILDMQRIENEAAAYKDFRLQTVDFTREMNGLNNAISAGGAIEQQAAELGQQQQIIGPQKFQEEMTKLRQLQAQYEQQLRIYNVYYQRMNNELLSQLQRVRAPILKDILEKRGAQVIIPKSLLLANASGLDVTTEFIEALDGQLSTVTINIPQRTAQSSGQPASGETSIDALPDGN